MLFYLGGYNMHLLSIKPADETDANLILSILLSSFAQYQDTLIPPSSVFRETTDSIQKKLQVGGGFIAYQNDIGIGCVLFDVRDSYVYLGRLGVLSEYRQYGVATRLIQSVEVKASQLQITQVRLNVRISLSKNQALFNSLGYKKIAEHCHEGFDKPTYIDMAKDIES